MKDQRIVYQGMPTPWGTAQTASILAPGIGMVTTAGHGGVKLSRDRQAKIPDYMRCEGAWYEEDCECNIVFTVFLDELLADGSPCPQWLKDGLIKHPPAATIANYWPDKYERYFNRKLAPEESHVLRERAFKVAHANDYCVLTAWGSWQDGVSEGFVGVFATLGEKRWPDPAYEQGKYFLVPQAEYDARQGTFVIDLSRHPQVEDFTDKTKRVA
jgi:hypothetical protein